MNIFKNLYGTTTDYPFPTQKEYRSNSVTIAKQVQSTCEPPFSQSVKNIMQKRTQEL